MADDKFKRKPSRLDGRSELDGRGVAQLVALGRLLDELAWPRNETGFPSRHSPEREDELRKQIYNAEEEIEKYIYLESNSGLRRVLSIVRQGVADEVAVRIIAYCSFVFLMTSSPRPSVGQIAKAVGIGNLHDSLEARRIIYEMARQGETLVYKDDEFHGGGIKIGERLRKFLNGDSRTPILFDESTIQASCNQTALRSATRRPSRTNNNNTPFSSPELQTQATPSSSPTIASEIMKRMQEYVIGENISTALRRYCCRLALHLQRKRMIDHKRQPDSPAECLLILGQSGTGKTHIVNTTAKILDLPVASISACDLTCEGYVGLSVSDAVATLMRVSAGNPSRCQTAVLHLDEWDKKRSSGGSSRDGGIDVFGTAVQQSVLRLMDGQSNYQVGGRKNFDGKPIQVDSRGLLYIFSGAFTDLPAILQRQRRTKTGIGFGMTSNDADGMMAIRSALIEYGLIEEFVNRLTAVVSLPRPSVQDLEAILTAKTGVLAMYNSQFSAEGMSITMTPPAIRYLAEWAYMGGLARSLKLVVSCLAEEMVFSRHQGVAVFDKCDVAKAIEGMTTQFG